jgi:hypothetical protein
MGIQLIENWRESWRWASVRLAALVGIVSGVLTASPELLLGLIGFLPEGRLRLGLSVGVALIVFGLPTLVRIFRKEPCDEPADKPTAS